MTNLPALPSTPPVDGFSIEDFEARSGANYGKFDAVAASKWHGSQDGAGLHLGPYLAMNAFKELLKWSDKRVVERIIQEPDKPLPAPTISMTRSTRKTGKRTSTAIPKGHGN